MTEESLSRRSVLLGAAVTAAAGVTGYVVAAGSAAADAKAATAAANDYGVAETTGDRLAAVGDIPAGGGLILASARVVLTLSADGAVTAFSATCTHQGCTVNAIEDGVIVCPCHLSRFDLRTGAVVSGPASRPLPPVPVQVRDGDVFTG